MVGREGGGGGEIFDVHGHVRYRVSKNQFQLNVADVYPLSIKKNVLFVKNANIY